MIYHLCAIPSIFKCVSFGYLQYSNVEIFVIRCSASVESLPSTPTHNSTHDQSDLQTMRVTVGLPLKRPPRYASLAESSIPIFSSNAKNINSSQPYDEKSQDDEYSMHNEDIDSLTIFCTSDFTTVSKEVYRRMRRVRLLGLEV